MELTIYLGEKTIQYALRNQRRFLVSWGCHCESTHLETTHLQSNHEEADTKIILHAIDATSNGATTINIHSPDTDVFVLLIRRYPELCRNTNFVTGVGTRHRSISLRPIFHALGKEKSSALPAFHALSGADITGCFSGKGKKICWKVFISADEDIVSALGRLGTIEQPDEETMKGIGKFVCKLYQQNCTTSDVGKLRWSLFKKNQAQSERLPPTQGSLFEAILRANYQTLVWNNDKVSTPDIPSPEGYGWKLDNNGKWVPLMTRKLPAPEAIIELVKCGCTKQRCSNNRCQCRKSGFHCTELCACCDGDDDDCENSFEPIEDDVDDMGADSCDDSDGVDEDD